MLLNNNNLNFLIRHINTILEQSDCQQRVFTNLQENILEDNRTEFKFQYLELDLITQNERVAFTINTVLKANTPQQIKEEILEDLYSQFYMEILKNTVYEPDLIKESNQIWKMN